LEFARQLDLQAVPVFTAQGKPEVELGVRTPERSPECWLVSVKRRSHAQPARTVRAAHRVAPGYGAAAIERRGGDPVRPRVACEAEGSKVHRGTAIALSGKQRYCAV